MAQAHTDRNDGRPSKSDSTGVTSGAASGAGGGGEGEGDVGSAAGGKLLHDARVPRAKPISGGGAMISIGAIVCLFGSYILVIGMGWLAPEKANVPLWVLQVMGGVILAIGLATLGNGVVHRRAGRRREQARQEHLTEPWLWDYTGSQRETAASGVHDALVNMAKLLAVLLFLVPFHWIGIYKAWPFLIFCGIFDLIMLAVLWAQVQRLLQGMKFGRARLMLGRFPFFLGDELQANFQTTRGGGAMRNIEATLTLRCIEEKQVSTGSGKSQRTVVYYTELYAQQQIAQVQDRRQGWNLPVFFKLPEGLPATNLSSNPAIYWEVEIQAALPGVDLCERLLVPVYAKNVLR